jgi:hypothetical protein
LTDPRGGVFLASLEHGRVPSPRPIAAKEIPLIDRVEEMDVLKEAVYRAVHGEGGLVFVHGARFAVTCAFSIIALI